MRRLAKGVERPTLVFVAAVLGAWFLSYHNNSINQAVRGNSTTTPTEHDEQRTLQELHNYCHHRLSDGVCMDETIDAQDPTCMSRACSGAVEQHRVEQEKKRLYGQDNQ